jgi:hypothetical protein
MRRRVVRAILWAASNMCVCVCTAQMGGWSGEEVLPSLGLPAFPGAAFSGAGTMMSMPQAAPSAYPGLQGLWGPVTQPPPTGEPHFLLLVFSVGFVGPVLKVLVMTLQVTGEWSERS